MFVDCLSRPELLSRASGLHWYVLGTGNSPTIRPPAYRARPTPCAGGEQIPRASAIMLPIYGKRPWSQSEAV